MLRNLISAMGASPAPVPWRSDDDGGNAVGTRCIGATLIGCALDSGVIQQGEGVTTDPFPQADDMFGTFQLIFPNMASREPQRLRDMTSAMIGHNDRSAHNVARMSKAWRVVENLVGRESNLAAAA